jgi:hypothetical protein
MSLPRTSCSQSGKGRLGCIFSLLILGALAFGLYRIVPPYFSYFQLKDAVVEIATLSAVGSLPRSDGLPGRSAGAVQDIQEAVLVKAKELEIPLEREKIKVRREGQVVFISVSYTVPIDLLVVGYSYPLAFTVHN